MEQGDLLCALSTVEFSEEANQVERLASTETSFLLELVEFIFAWFAPTSGTNFIFSLSGFLPGTAWALRFLTSFHCDRF
uniref:Uncharacterized protein n=1 Tax=Arundo donax TaxID=35708 RepID=A0A0A9NXU1_ARUDO